jgi:hypothetical protein
MPTELPRVLVEVSSEEAARRYLRRLPAEHFMEAIPQATQKYEHELKVPYYLLFVPESQELTLYHHNGTKYVSVPPNAQGRYAVAELGLEVGQHGGWMRYWLRGELLPLPAELQARLEETRRELAQERQARLAAEQEVARLRAELERLKKEERGR